MRPENHRRPVGSRTPETSRKAARTQRLKCWGLPFCSAGACYRPPIAGTGARRPRHPAFGATREREEPVSHGQHAHATFLRRALLPLRARRALPCKSALPSHKQDPVPPTAWSQRCQAHRGGGQDNGALGATQDGQDHFVRIFFGQDLQDEQDMAQEENPAIPSILSSCQNSSSLRSLRSPR